MTATQPTPDQIQAFIARGTDAPVSMVNLLKFKDKATYDADRPEAAEKLTGQEAYARYGAEVGKILETLGAKTLFAGPAHGMMIGSGDWDMVAIVEYPSRAVMAGMGTSAEYQAIHYHRDAGLAHQLLIDTTRII
jgi:uncharacterized protein (DUF1330 family)